MQRDSTVVRVEQTGIALSIVVLAMGIAELTGTISVFPVSAYVTVLWIIAGLLWVIRRRHT